MALPLVQADKYVWLYVGCQECQHVWYQALQNARAPRLHSQQVHPLVESSQVHHVQSPCGSQLKVAPLDSWPWAVQHDRTRQKQRQTHSLKIRKLPCNLLPQKQTPQLVLGTNENLTSPRSWIMYFLLNSDKTDNMLQTTTRFLAHTGRKFGKS